MNSSSAVSRFLSTAAVAVGVLLLSAGVQTYAAGVWTPPAGAPPTSDASAPLTTSTATQIKAGSLTVNSAGNALGFYLPSGRIQVGDNGASTVTSTVGLALFGKQLRIVDGTEGAGKVLTSNANGLASWQAASGVTSKCGTSTNCTTLPDGTFIQWGSLLATSGNRTNGSGVATRLITMPVNYATPSSYNITLTPYGTIQSIASEDCLPAARGIGSPGGFNMVTDGNCDGVTFMWQTIGR